MDPQIEADIALSGLTPDEIVAREARSPEWAAVGSTSGSEIGYVIPYFSFSGDPIAHYRIRLVSSVGEAEGRYRQPKKTPSFLYYPPNFALVLERKAIFDPPIIVITQGELNALRICRMGIPCVALTDTNAWRNRVLILPGDVNLSGGPSGRGTNDAKGPPTTLKAAIPASMSSEIVTEDFTIAYGLRDLIDYAHSSKVPLVMVFDSYKGVPKPADQRHLAELGYELRFRGIATPQIKQLLLPYYGGEFGRETPVSEFISKRGPKALTALLMSLMKKKRTAFPRHPNPREHLSTKLQIGRMSRREAQGLALMILTELDCAGRRFFDAYTRQPYYFNDETCTLMPVSIANRMGPPLHEQAFGRHLYEKFSLQAGDLKVINWLASQYTGEQPIGEVAPKRVLTELPDPKSADCIALQISDSQFVVVGPDPDNPIEVCSNGTKGILFANDQVEPIDGKELSRAFFKQKSALTNGAAPMWWLDIWKNFQIKGALGQTNEGHVLAALLCYLSPWLRSWRGLQLPVEMIIGEPGTGKSSLLTLRQMVITGRPRLRNIPSDVRDWHASVSSTGGLHVTDNVHFTKPELRQRISDEMCRIVTEPDPFIEMRRLYTSAELLRVPARVVFALTAIQQPFHTVDLVQRSIVINLARGTTDWDSSWVEHQLQMRGGRTEFLAHHLLVLHLFLHAVARGGAWDPEYSANNRLAHLEQSLVILGELFGMPSDFIPQLLSESTDRVMSEADWTLEGIKRFSEYWMRRIDNNPNAEGRFSTAEIVDWSMDEDDFKDNKQLTNSRRLGRYLQSHEDLVKRMTGVVYSTSKANKRYYIVGRQI